MNSTESPSVLTTRPALRDDDVVAAALEDLDQVADLVVVEPVGERAEADQVGEPDRRLGQLLVGRALEALHPRDRGDAGAAARRR